MRRNGYPPGAVPFHQTSAIAWSEEHSGALFSYVDLEDRVPGSHPARTVRVIVNQALDALTGDFDLLFRWFSGLGIDDPVRYDPAIRAGGWAEWSTSSRRSRSPTRSS